MRILIKQVIWLLRQNPLMSAITILGTGFAICLLMVMCISWQIRYGPSAPEVNLDRTLYISWLCLQGKEDTSSNSVGHASPAFMKACIWPSEAVEASSAISYITRPLLSVPGQPQRFSADYRSTDPAFWQIYRFDFIDGRPFSDADVYTDLIPVVVAESVARRLFGRTDIAGERLLINRETAVVTGVVRDISLTAAHSYAQIWGKYNPAYLEIPASEYDWLDGFDIAILARSRGEMPQVHTDVNRMADQLSSSLATKNVKLFGQPDSHIQFMNREGWGELDMKKFYMQYLLVVLIIFLVPALNLSGLFSSRIRERLIEVGVRKAFGSTSRGLLRQVLGENLLLTCLGGVAGLLLSYGALFLFREWFFVTPEMLSSSGPLLLSVRALLHPLVFVMAFFFCLCMNLLSAWLPAWKVVKQPIVECLNQK